MRLITDGTLKPLTVKASPPIRVGAASVVVAGKIYLWGGRGGKEMTPIDEEGKFWVFDPDSSIWSQTATPSGDIPEPRSYHSLATINVYTNISVLSVRIKFIFMRDVLPPVVSPHSMSMQFLRIRGGNALLRQDPHVAERLWWRLVRNC